MDATLLEGRETRRRPIDRRRRPGRGPAGRGGPARRPQLSPAGGGGRPRDGAILTDVDGVEYLDFLAAYSATNFGHSHPRLVAAARAQLDRLTLTSRAFHHDQLAPFATALAQLVGKEMVLPMNTGAEAVETGIKLARKWG